MSYKLNEDLINEIFKFIDYKNVLEEIKTLNDIIDSQFYVSLSNMDHYEEYYTSLILRKRRILRRCRIRVVLYHNFMMTCKFYYKKIDKLALKIEDKILI